MRIWSQRAGSRYVRDGTEDASGQDRHFGVRDKTHGGVVVALDPEVDGPAQLLEHSWRRSLRCRLAGLSLRRGSARCHQLT